jgi:hypothetical protein
MLYLYSRREPDKAMRRHRRLKVVREGWGKPLSA